MDAIVRSPRDDCPVTEPAPSAGGLFLARTVTVLLVAGPPIAIAVAAPLLWGRLLSLFDLALALTLYVVTGFGVTVGYHRLFAHRSFRARRGLKLALAAAGS